MKLECSLTSERLRLVRYYDNENTRRCTLLETNAVRRSFAPDSGLDEETGKIVVKESRIKNPMAIHRLSKFLPFDSIPIDTMYLGYNISKDLLEILKGENIHLRRVAG